MKTFNQFILENIYVFDNKTPIQYSQKKEPGKKLNTYLIRGYNTRIRFRNASLSTDKTSVVNSELLVSTKDGMQLTKQDSLEKIFQTVAYMFANYIMVSKENPNRIVGKIKIIEGYSQEAQSYLEEYLPIVKKTGRTLGFDFKFDYRTLTYQIDPYNEKEKEPVVKEKKPRKVIRAAKRFLKK